MSEAQHATQPTKAAKPRGRPFQKGHPGGPGRKPGESVGIVRTLREAVEIAARDCHPQGLAGWLVERAQGGVQDRVIFANMVGKVIPIQVNQNVEGGIAINLNWLGQRNIGTITAQPRVIDAQTVELIEQSPDRRWTTDATATGHATPEPVGAAQTASGYPSTSEPAIAPPAAFRGPARGTAAAGDPPSPVEAGPGGVARAGAPHPPSQFQK